MFLSGRIVYARFLTQDPNNYLRCWEMPDETFQAHRDAWKGWIRASSEHYLNSLLDVVFTSDVPGGWETLSTPRLKNLIQLFFLREGGHRTCGLIDNTVLPLVPQFTDWAASCPESPPTPSKVRRGRKPKSTASACASIDVSSSPGNEPRTKHTSNPATAAKASGDTNESALNVGGDDADDLVTPCECPFGPEPLRPGEVIRYYAPPFRAGDAQGLRTATVMSTDPFATNYMIRLNTIDLLPDYHSIKRIKVNENGKLTDHDGYFREIRMFAMKKCQLDVVSRDPFSDLVEKVGVVLEDNKPPEGIYRDFMFQFQPTRNQKADAMELGMKHNIESKKRKEIVRKRPQANTVKGPASGKAQRKRR
jgi:hypothetical protein